MHKEIKLNNQRASFTRRIKRKILLEIADGKKPIEVILKYASEVVENNTTDKKYALKLIHKWKKEMYENKEILNILNHKIDNEIIEDEINAINIDENEDILGVEIKSSKYT